MLKRFRVNNFKSLLNFEFLPAGMNVLVGPNNAGKTNLCQALRMLSLSSYCRSLDAAALGAVGESWNLTNVYLKAPAPTEFEVDCRLVHDGQPMDFSYRLSIDALPATAPPQLRVAEETLTVTGGAFRETVLLDRRDRQAKLLNEEDYITKGGVVSYAEATADNDATMLSRLYERKDNPLAMLFRNYLVFWSYFSLSPEAIRSPEVNTPPGVVSWDGKGLNGALHLLHNQNPRAERKVIEALKALEPKLDFFSFYSPDPSRIFVYLEDDSRHRFSTQGMSDGTLRFLAISYLLHQHQEMASGWGFAPLVIIEEPENGLYVRCLKPLMDGIDPSGRGGQFIFTTHSPYFIDLFDGALDGLHVIRPGRPSSVLVKPDKDKIRRYLDQMPLGEMHFREMLG